MWQIINDEDFITLTIHELTSEFDSGDIVLENNIPNKGNLHIQEILEEINFGFSKLLTEFFSNPGKCISEKRAQQELDARYWHQRTEADGYIDWNSMTALQVYNFVRAISHPYPGSFSFLSDGSMVRIWRVDIDFLPICGVPGRIVRMKDGVHVVAMSNSSVKLVDFDCSRDIQSGEFLYKYRIGN